MIISPRNPPTSSLSLIHLLNTTLPWRLAAQISFNPSLHLGINPSHTRLLSPPRTIVNFLSQSLPLLTRPISNTFLACRWGCQVPNLCYVAQRRSGIGAMEREKRREETWKSEKLRFWIARSKVCEWTRWSNVVGPGGFYSGLALRDNMEGGELTKALDSIISILCPPPQGLTEL